jgi:hypothetical protein
MPDSAVIDAALVSKLGSDATLLGYMTNGVYFDEAPPNSTRFVIISLVEESDERTFDGRSHEDAVYLVKAVALSTVANAATHTRNAAARIDALLDGQVLTATGYTHMAMHRENRIRFTEVDEEDSTIRWFHRGGQYRVVMST